MTDFQIPQIRYTSFSNFLSGVSLFDRDQRPRNAANDFFDLNPTLFLGILDEKQLIGLLHELGFIETWREQGHSKISLSIEQPSPHCFMLSVFTELNDAREILLHAIIWLEYTQIDALSASFPSICVEHLRLQNPRHNTTALLPGQDFAPSGLFRRAFGLARYFALKTGAQLITEVPQYFHTAWIFSSHFSYIDPEMDAIYRNIKADLLPPNPTFCDAAAISRAFESDRVYCDQQIYRWPNELQAHAMSSEIHWNRSLESSNLHFVIHSS